MKEKKTTKRNTCTSSTDMGSIVVCYHKSSLTRAKPRVLEGLTETPRKIIRHSYYARDHISLQFQMKLYEIDRVVTNY